MLLLRNLSCVVSDESFGANLLDFNVQMMLVWLCAVAFIPRSHIGSAAWRHFVEFRREHPMFAQLPAQALAALSVFIVAQSLVAFVEGARSPGIKAASWAADACDWFFYLNTFLTCPVFSRPLSKDGRAWIVGRLYFLGPAWALLGAVAVLARVMHDSPSRPSLCHLE
jgi:hypothetical protein